MKITQKIWSINLHRYALAILFMLTVSYSQAQNNSRTQLINSSQNIFRLEVEQKIDSLALLLNDQLVVLNSAGDTQTKGQYVSRLKSGNFIHNDIKLEDNKAIVNGNTGVVTGKGIFTITVNGTRSVIHLSYLETFIRNKGQSAWKLLALHASIIPQPVAQ